MGFFYAPKRSLFPLEVVALLGYLGPSATPCRKVASRPRGAPTRISHSMPAKKKSPTTRKSSTTVIDIGISAAARRTIADGLAGLLADSYTLYLMTHNFHWNVTGPMFNTLHLMFMGQYTEQWTALDLIAERIRALGFPAPGTYQEFVALASVREVAGVPKALEMVTHLVRAQEATARTARALFSVVERARDQPTMDLLTQRLDVHEKTAWMLRSLLEE